MRILRPRRAAFAAQFLFDAANVHEPLAIKDKKTSRSARSPTCGELHQQNHTSAEMPQSNLLAGGFAILKKIHPEGIEPPAPEPESDVLSVKLWVLVHYLFEPA